MDFCTVETARTCGPSAGDSLPALMMTGCNGFFLMDFCKEDQTMETKYLPVSEESARAAWELNHMSDYRPGSATAEYRAAVDAAAQLAEERKAATSEFYRARIDGLFEAYCRKLAAWTDAYHRNEASCPSVLISGAGNFPTHKKAKQNARRDALMQERREIDALLEKLRAVGTGGVDLSDPDARAALESKLAAARADHERMKAANAQYRRTHTLDGLAIDAKTREWLTRPGVFARGDGSPLALYGCPYPSYALDGQRDLIHRLEARLQELDKLDAIKAQQPAGEAGDGWRVERDAESVRLRIIFDGVPDAETRAALKGEGFRWSPKNQAWQRQLTDNAERALRRLLPRLPAADPMEIFPELPAAEPMEISPQIPAPALLALPAPAPVLALPAPAPISVSIILRGDQYQLSFGEDGFSPAASDLPGKYARLRDDLRAALEAGRAAEAADPEDGGTCNFDAAALSLPRWSADLIRQAAQEAGTGCFSWDCYGKRLWVIGPDTRAQGNARSRNAEAMVRALQAAGYDALDYCQMD